MNKGSHTQKPVVDKIMESKKFDVRIENWFNLYSKSHIE